MEEIQSPHFTFCSPSCRCFYLFRLKRGIVIKMHICHRSNADTTGTAVEITATYLSKLESGMEPDPLPNNPFLPLSNFSTTATFPIRAASRSSCSFPIIQKRGERGGGRGWRKIKSTNSDRQRVWSSIKSRATSSQPAPPTEAAGNNTG